MNTEGFLSVSIKVIEEYGDRKKNDVIEELIDKFLKEKNHPKK
jgi:hypothetical protein